MIDRGARIFTSWAVWSWIIMLGGSSSTDCQISPGFPRLCVMMWWAVQTRFCIPDTFCAWEFRNIRAGRYQFRCLSALGSCVFFSIRRVEFERGYGDCYAPNLFCPLYLLILTLSLNIMPWYNIWSKILILESNRSSSSILPRVGQRSAYLLTD